MRGFIVLWLGLLLGGCDHHRDLPYVLALEEDDLGSIHLGDPFDLSILAPKLVGIHFDTMAQVNPIQPQRLYVLRHADETLGYLLSDQKRVGGIHIISPRVTLPHGLHIGGSIGMDFPCRDGICHDIEYPAITYRVDRAWIIHEAWIGK